MRDQVSLWTVHRKDADIECSVELLGEDLLDLHVDGGAIHIEETYHETGEMLERADLLKQRIEDGDPRPDARSRSR